MDVKVEVLRSQFQWRNSRINNEACHEMFQVQNFFKRWNGKTYGEQHITLNIKKKTCFQSSRDEDPNLAWSKLVSSKGGLL